MADIKRLPCFTIDSESKPGQLLTFVRRFKDANVNLLGIWAFETRPGTGQCYVVAQDSAALRKLLQATGWKFKETTCFHLTGDDKAGALVETLEPVAKDGINLQAVEGIGAGGKYGAFLFADPKDTDRIGKILKA
jgi:prephenate dehydratase